MNSLNNDIIKNLEFLKDYYKQTKDKWKYQSYSQAIQNIKQYEKEITSEKESMSISGIGKGISKKIGQLLTKGEIEEVVKIKSLQNNTPDSIVVELEKIWGIGPVKAKHLVENGISSIEELKQNQDKLTNQQKIGLKYYKELQQKIPRDNITIFGRTILKLLKKYYDINKFTIKIAGSYRRNSSMSGDIDLLISSDIFDLKTFVNLLKQNNIILDILSVKDEKFMGIAKANEQIVRFDIEFVSKEEWATALNYFTGSQQHNIMLRKIALKQGLKLNQHGLFRGSECIHIKTEEDIYKILGIKYIEPNNR